MRLHSCGWEHNKHCWCQHAVQAPVLLQFAIAQTNFLVVIMRQPLPRLKHKSPHSLQITTHTSDIEGAATSAHVLMALSGTAGSSGALELSHPNPMPASSNGFARGEAASFTFGCAGLGDLQQLVVWHDSSGAQPAWHLAYVEVAELSTGKVKSKSSAGGSTS